MEIEFWYSDSIPTPGIQFVTENLYTTISFKNIDKFDKIYKSLKNIKIDPNKVYIEIK